MKNRCTTLLFICMNLSLFGQVSGNINYNGPISLQQSFLNTSEPNPNQILINVKGLANVKADAYLALFSVTQVGKSQEEASQLIESRISKSLEKIRIKKGVEVYLDMISFVPTYQYEAEKKIFSKKTYNEIPSGFEIKKNIHIKFSDPSILNEILLALSENEIYDLIRVDYYVANLENIKKELANKAKTLLLEKMKNYTEILGESFANTEKSFNEEYKVMLPVEMYKAYEASKSSVLNLNRPASINQTQKSITPFYQPVFSKEFDFILNPMIVEPVIQVLYDFKLLLIKNPNENKKQEKQYLIVTPNGEVKNINFSS